MTTKLRMASISCHIPQQMISFDEPLDRAKESRLLPIQTITLSTAAEVQCHQLGIFCMFACIANPGQKPCRLTPASAGQASQNTSAFSNVFF